MKHKHQLCTPLVNNQARNKLTLMLDRINLQLHWERCKFCLHNMIRVFSVLDTSPTAPGSTKLTFSHTRTSSLRSPLPCRYYYTINISTLSAVVCLGSLPYIKYRSPSIRSWVQQIPRQLVHEITTSYNKWTHGVQVSVLRTAKHRQVQVGINSPDKIGGQLWA